MKTLTGDPNRFPEVRVNAYGTDPWGVHVVAGPVQALTDRTQYLKRFQDLQVEARYYTYGGEEPVSPGDVIVAGASGDATTVYRAVTFRLSQAGGVLGVALEGATGPGPLLVATGGIVPASITGLSGGDAAIVSVDSNTARCRRGHQVGGTPVVGYCGLGGALTVAPHRIDIMGQGEGGTGIWQYVAGDMIVANQAALLTRLPVGNSGDTLTVQNGLPAWRPPKPGVYDSVIELASTVTADNAYHKVGSSIPLVGGRNYAVYVYSEVRCVEGTIAAYAKYSKSALHSIGVYVATDGTAEFSDGSATTFQSVSVTSQGRIPTYILRAQFDKTMTPWGLELLPNILVNSSYLGIQCLTRLSVALRALPV